jgi:DNA-directed RNA polymerase
MFTEFSETDPGLLKLTERKLTRSTSGSHRRAVMRHALKLTDIKGLEWTKTDKLHVGTKLIDLMVQVTGLCEIVMEKEGRKTVYNLCLSEKTQEWLERQHSRCELLSPIYMPMVCPPKDWSHPLGGGYLSGALNSRLAMVKVWRNPNVLDELFNTHMPEVYSAVNALQRTPWRINKGVHAIAAQLWASSSSIGGLPDRDDLPLPPTPSWLAEGMTHEDMTKQQKQAFNEWKAERAAVYTANARLRSKRFSVSQQLWLGDKFSEFEAIYFPYQLDFRGRIYAIPSLVNPQADDLGRGLLEFADGKPLGPEGWKWLAIHIANLFGVDKVSYDDRLQWTLDNSDALLDSGLRPLDGEQFWTTADGGANAWQALAACREWAGYIMQGEDYVSHLPIGMDGSCSGLQHFSALLKDSQGGAAVNLVPGEKPADIYTTVANKVIERLETLSEPEALAWRDKVKRSIVKQPAMTYAYSVTRVGIRDQIQAALRKEDATGQYLDGLSYYKAASFLAPLVLEAIEDTVIAAAGAMKWLQEMSRVVSDHNIPIQWTSPAGLPVVQRRMKRSSKQHPVWVEGRRVQLRLHEDTDKIDGRGQSSSIAPNFVHSLDSAHLMKTVNALVETHGFQHFAMIHDSFGVHACDVEDLHQTLRETFVRMYQTDWLGEFQREVEELLRDEDIEQPERPPFGDLELESVLDSDYFFA